MTAMPINVFSDIRHLPCFPVRWHAPRNFLLCIRNSTTNDLTYFIKIRPDGFILFFNVLIYCLDLTTVMTLTFTAEAPTAFRAFPHIQYPPITVLHFASAKS